uniref:Androglobin n=1 Tax=Homo sapiens TaxID=9606 RepID=E5RIM8_HUMAN
MASKQTKKKEVHRINSAHGSDKSKESKAEDALQNQ